MIVPDGCTWYKYCELPATINMLNNQDDILGDTTEANLTIFQYVYYIFVALIHKLWKLKMLNEVKLQ